MTTTNKINFALPSGRILDTLRSMFNDLGLLPVLAPNSRQLIAPAEDFSFLSMVDVKPSDVPLYVQEGFTSIGICGPDVWEEMQSSCRNTTIALELPGNPLRFSLIGTPAQKEVFEKMLFNLDQGANQAFNVATKYTNLTKRCVEDLVLDNSVRIALEMLKLTGKVELGPLLMNMIAADLIETGGTLKANGLVEIKTLREWDKYCVIVNKGQQDNPRVQQIIGMLRDNVAEYTYNPDDQKVRSRFDREEAIPTKLELPGVTHAGAHCG